MQLKHECNTCIEAPLRGGPCPRIMHGLACQYVKAGASLAQRVAEVVGRNAAPPPSSLKPGKIVWLPEGESPAEYIAPPHGSPRQARDTQVAGDHYKKMGVEPWDVVDDTWPVEQRIGAYRHGALKYLMRMGSKDQSAQEIARGKHYMEKLLEVLREADDEQAALKQGENTGSIK